MLLSLILLILILAITIRQATQGLFGAFLMCFLTICCASAAIGTHEWGAVHALDLYRWKPDYALAVVLGATFGVPLLILRLVFDKLIHRSCLLPAFVDRVGGAICGFVTAMTTVGVLALCLQLIPFNLYDGSLLGYSRVEVASLAKAANNPQAKLPSKSARERELWLTPDRFAVGLAAVVAHGVFSGSIGFYDHNPDMIQTVGWVGTTHSEVSRFAPPQSIGVVKTEPIEFVYKFIPGDAKANKPANYEPERPPSGAELRMVRVQIKNEARDEKKSVLFTLRQFRLVGRVGQDVPGQVLEQHYPIAIQQEDAATTINRHIRYEDNRGSVWPVVDKIFSPRDESSQVEVVFELPAGFRPSFIEYKREARAALSFSAPTATTTSTEPPRTERPPPGGAGAAVATPPPPQPSRRRPQPTTPSESATPAGSDSRGPDRGSPAPASETGSAATPSSSPPPGSSTPPASPPVGGEPKPDGGQPAGSEAPPQERPGGRVRGVGAKVGGSHFGDEFPLVLKSYRKVIAPEVSGGAMARGHVAGDAEQPETGNDAPISRFLVPKDKRLLQLNVGRLQARSTLGRALSHAVTTLQNYFVEDSNGNRYVASGKYALATAGSRKVLEVQYFGEVEESGGRIAPLREVNENNLKPDDDYVLLFLVEPGATIVTFSTGGDATRRDDLVGENLVAPR